MINQARSKPLKQYKYLIFLNMMFITIFIICDITAFRMVWFFGHEIPLSGLIIPLVFSLGDIIAEAYGYDVTMKVLKSGILCQLLFGLIITAALIFSPSPPNNTLNEHYNFAFQHILRTNLTSCFSVTSGMLVNAFLISKLKIRMNGKRFWIRTLLSSGFSEIVLCTVAYLILFGGLKDYGSIFEIIFFVWSYKMVISIFMTPITAVFGRIIKILEQSDVYDYGISYNPMKFSSRFQIEYRGDPIRGRASHINDAKYNKEGIKWEE